jgi:hypothetical protein
MESGAEPSWSPSSALERVPCLHNGHTHLPPTSISHLNIHSTTRDDSLQAMHDMRVGLKLNVIKYVIGCMRKNILDGLHLRTQINLLKFLDCMIVGTVFDVVKK